jgi:hypothetical protein
MLDEFFECEDAVKADTRFQERCAVVASKTFRS